MKLLRLATLNFNDLPSQYESIQLKLEGVSVGRLPIGNAPPTDGKRLMVGAVVDLPSMPAIDSAGVVLVPEGARRSCEAAIEALANTMSVLSRSARTISSPIPCVALLPETESDWGFLGAAKGLQEGFKAITSFHDPLAATPEILKDLADRVDGMALVAELYSQSHALGRYRECVRFIELAFARPLTDVEKKLAQFLASGEGGYERDEVVQWITLRHGAAHGDLAKTKFLVLEADVRPFIARLEQAVADVLFNKAIWHDPSAERRVVWRPSGITTSRRGDIRIRAGTAPPLKGHLLDQFGAYPVDLSAAFASTPEGWWPPKADGGPPTEG